MAVAVSMINTVMILLAVIPDLFTIVVTICDCLCSRIILDVC
jgi:hypothetical protein